ncbi:hypothetical protein D3C75_1306780 [compost metagenome]
MGYLVLAAKVYSVVGHVPCEGNEPGRSVGLKAKGSVVRVCVASVAEVALDESPDTGA